MVECPHLLPRGAPCWAAFEGVVGRLETLNVHGGITDGLITDFLDKAITGVKVMAGANTLSESVLL